MLTAARLLQDLGFLLYAGPMVAFTILIAVVERIPHVRPWDVVRTYRAWGAGLGLSLGACVFGGLAKYYLETGAFSWGWDSPAEQKVTLAFVAFLVMWAHNVRLEIWALEPLRKLDKEGEVTDPEAYRAAVKRFSGNQVFHAALCLVVAALGIVGGVV